MTAGQKTVDAYVNVNKEDSEILVQDYTEFVLEKLPAWMKK